MDNSSLPPQDDFIVLDTSVIYEIWGYSPKQIYKSNCEDFLKYTALNKNILCITVKTYEELNIKVQSNFIPHNKSTFNKDKQLYLNHSNTLVDNIMSSLNKLPNFYPEPIGVINANTLKEIQNNQIKHGLKWGDATIYTLTKQENMSNICSIDGDWSGVQDDKMSLYTLQQRINIT